MQMLAFDLEIGVRAHFLKVGISRAMQASTRLFNLFHTNSYIMHCSSYKPKHVRYDTLPQ